MAVPSTRLLVLALVRMLEPVHGYDVRRELLSWRAQDWANVRQGSIYGALKTLQRDGWIEPAETNQSGNRPERTKFGVTSEGAKELRIGLHEALWSVEHPKHPYMTIVTLFPFTERDDVVAALRARITRLEADVERANREVERVLAGSGDPAVDMPYHVADATRLLALHMDADLTWSRETLERIESGALDVWSATSPTNVQIE
ncbi:MAG: PadR family transcriptional regulator [Actinomycetia bacterium]|nr:PadR family transcriptional regulator [Actinomycetes bacterium]